MGKYDDYIGVPFEYGGRSKETAYDCYGLLIDLYKEFHNVDIPNYKSPTEVERISKIFDVEVSQWHEVEEREGAAVWIRISGYGAHVGFCIGNGLFMHTWERSGGVVIERLDSWRRRVIGYYEYR